MTSELQPTKPVPQVGSGAMFDAIAPRYDLLNRMISLGVDQSWRRAAVASLRLGNASHVLDVATGTGDLAIAIARTCPGCRVLGVDPSTKMMAIGQHKVEATGLDSRIEFRAGDAQHLELPDAEFDGLTIAFGIRNVPDRPRALREFVRVLRPGARAAVLELSEPRSGLLAAGARFHMHRIVPWLGGLLSGSREYRYLPQSIAEFPSPERFSQMMLDAGFAEVTSTALTFGVCQLYVGRVGA